jgi:hypothetical protein
MMKVIPETKEIFVFISRRNQHCLTTLSSSYDPNFLASERQRLPGQMYDADQQCANMAEVGSYMHRVCIT